MFLMIGLTNRMYLLTKKNIGEMSARRASSSGAVKACPSSGMLTLLTCQ